MTVVGAVLIAIGAVFCFLAALGLLRFPDLYTRMHAASKAGVLGAGLILIGAAFASSDIGVAVRAVIGVAFIVVTAPVSAHLLARAALRSGTKPDAATSIDEPNTNP